MPTSRERLKVAHACQACRVSKVKCDAGRPGWYSLLCTFQCHLCVYESANAYAPFPLSACIRCHARGTACNYNREDGRRTVKGRNRPKAAQRPVRPIRSCAPVPAPVITTALITAPNSPLAAHVSRLQTSPTTPRRQSSAAAPSARSDLEQIRDNEQNRSYYAAHGRFSGQVASAADVRAGLVPAATSYLVPFVDAPLFGNIGEQSARNVMDFAAELPRAYADKLVDIYWLHVHPVEPILDRQRFCRDYEAYYLRRSTLTHAESDVWVSTLHVVFALAVQVQESIPMPQRNDESNHYFRQAWALLRPEAFLWTPGTLDVVQCLMLMNRYLHCTNNQQKTWMTAGLAIQISQSMCNQASETPPSGEVDKDLRQKIWSSCVALER